MTVTTKGSDNKNLTVVNVSDIAPAAYRRVAFSLREPRGTILYGYEFIVTYSGNQLDSFNPKKKQENGVKIMRVVHEGSKNTTVVTYFFDNRGCLNGEDSYHRVSMLWSTFAARVNNR